MIAILEDARERADRISQWLHKKHGQTPVWIPDPEAFIAFLKRHGKLRAISLDHDLAHRLTGYDVAKWIAENQIDVDVIYVHSMNPVGAAKMTDVLKRAGYKVIRLTLS